MIMTTVCVTEREAGGQRGTLTYSDPYALGKYWKWDLNPGRSTPEPTLLSSMLNILPLISGHNLSRLKLSISLV